MVNLIRFTLRRLDQLANAFQLMKSSENVSCTSRFHPMCIAKVISFYSALIVVDIVIVRLFPAYEGGKITTYECDRSFAWTPTLRRGGNGVSRFDDGMGSAAFCCIINNVESLFRIR
jgi:hypothetical protein